MTPLKNRLNHNEVEEVFNSGQTIHSGGLMFKFVSKENQNTKLAFIVPKKAVKSVIKRNKLRRRGYSAIKSLKSSLPQSINGAFIFKKSGVEKFYNKKRKDLEPYKALELEIKNILQKL